MNHIKLIVLIVLVSITVSMLGCAGGGSGSPSVVEKDVTGITATLNKFAASLQSGTVANSGVFAQTSGYDGHSTAILYIQDFGKDLVDPKDNVTWYFNINPADISQPSPDVAYLKASRMMPGGNTLWLSFALVREKGIWLIETLEVINSVATSFVSASYFPITPGASHTYAILENGIVLPSYTQTGFAKNAIVINGITLYQMLETSTYYGNKKTSIRPSRRSVRAATEYASSYFGIDSHGQVVIYDPLINNGVPYVVFKTSYDYGAKDQFTEVWSSDGSTETTVTNFTVGYPQTLVTPLRTFSVVPLTLDFTVTYDTTTYNDRTIIYLAEGKGIVGYDYFDESNVLVAQERLLKTDVNGTVESNHPVVTAPASSQNIVAGQNMPSVQFAVADGRTPISWSATNLPSGLTLSSTGLLSGQLGSGVPLGSINLTVSATDIYSRRGDLQFTLNVVDASAVTLTVPSSSQNAIIGQPIAQMQFSAADSGTVTWSSSGAPAGVSISSGGLLSGTPVATTAPGAYAIIITATNAIGQSGSFVYTLNLTAPPVTFSPSFSSTMGYPGRQDAWLMLDGSSFQYADYSITAIEVDPVTAVNYIPFFADPSGYAQIGVISFQSGVTISFKVQITRKSDLAVFTSAAQTISVGSAVSKR